MADHRLACLILSLAIGACGSTSSNDTEPPLASGGAGRAAVVSKPSRGGAATTPEPVAGGNATAGKPAEVTAGAGGEQTVGQSGAPAGGATAGEGGFSAGFDAGGAAAGGAAGDGGAAGAPDASGGQSAAGAGGVPPVTPPWKYCANGKVCGAGELCVYDQRVTPTWICFNWRTDPIHRCDPYRFDLSDDVHAYCESVGPACAVPYPNCNFISQDSKGTMCPAYSASIYCGPPVD